MDLSVAIVGSGFSGIGLAIRLKQRGVEDFAVFERGEGVGGTWHFNTYPGCGCDVPSHLYSFSFAPNPDWSLTYSKQPEIRAYLERVVEDFGIAPHIRLRTDVRAARWDEAATGWELDTTRGPARAQVLVSATGPLVEPKIPEIPGLDRFAGPAFHSARWDHSVDLKGKRVASVGTGASAIQFVPAIAPEVERLHVFQRTPPWVMPHSSRPISGAEKRVFKTFPAVQRLLRVVDMPVAKMVHGRDGRALDDVWDGSPRAHLGSTVAGFPNFFILLGPNTGLGHNSMVYMIESQVAYVMDALREMNARGAGLVEVRPDAEERYNAEVQRRMKRTVWSTGCKSWYLDEKGNNPTLWPDWTWRFRQRTARFNPAEYVLA